MTSTPPRLRLLAAAASLMLAISLSACSTMPTGGSGAARGAYKATAGISVQARIEKAVEFLGAGNEAHARVELLKALEEQPGHPAARSLLGQIEVDPKTLLGEKNYSYTVKPGDTLSGLADKLLGDRLKFYALARYNGMAKPEELEVGRVLLIPGEEKKAAPAPATNPARARQLRGQALQKMNSGAIDAAVSLLRQALSFDPGSALIQRDLERALRIQTTLRSRP